MANAGFLISEHLSGAKVIGNQLEEKATLREKSAPIYCESVQSYLVSIQVVLSNACFKGNSFKTTVFPSIVTMVQGC